MTKPVKAFYIGQDSVRLDGYISQYWNTSDELEAILAMYEAQGKPLDIYINSLGGSVTQGIAMNNRIARAKVPVRKIVTGLAASMAGFLTVGKGGYMYKTALLMLHKPKGEASGESQQMRKAADAIDKFEASLIEMMKAKTGQTEAEIKAKYFIENTDVWLTAQEAYDAGLIEGLLDTDERIAAPSALLRDPIAVYDFYAYYLPTSEPNPPTNRMNLQVTALAVGLTANATEAEVTAKLQELVAAKKQLETLQAGIEAAALAEAKGVVDKAIAEGKIVEADRPMYEGLAKGNVQAVRNLFDKMPAKESVAASLITGQKPEGELKGIPAARKDWSFTDWSQKDPQGLKAIRAEQPETYKALFESDLNYKNV